MPHTTILRRTLSMYSNSPALYIRVMNLEGKISTQAKTTDRREVFFT